VSCTGSDEMSNQVEPQGQPDAGPRAFGATSDAAQPKSTPVTRTTRATMVFLPGKRSTGEEAKPRKIVTLQPVEEEEPPPSEPDPRQLSLPSMPAPVLVAASESAPADARSETRADARTDAPAKRGPKAKDSKESKEPPARPRRSAVAPRGEGSEASEGINNDEQFCAYALRIGHDRAQALLARMFDPFLADVPEEPLL
jgi:hypothetical protein